MHNALSLCIYTFCNPLSPRLLVYTHIIFIVYAGFIVKPARVHILINFRESQQIIARKLEILYPRNFNHV